MVNDKFNNLNSQGVSVVIVTYNGSRRIMPTIKHLLEQKDIDFPWEVLIVDNNSSDNTASIATELWNSTKVPCELRIIKEERPGTMYARRKGIEEARYRYLLYCDDDNWFHDLYVKTAFDIISSNNEIAAVGGMGVMEYEEGFTPPSWIKNFEKNYGTTPQGKVDGDTTYSKGTLYTAGAIIDRVWLNKLYQMGFKSSLKGRDGKSLLAGEDTELCFALKLIGGKLYYSSKMHFKHFMPSERIQWEYLKKLWRSFGYSDFIISPYSDFFQLRKLPSINKRRVQRLRELGVLYLKIHTKKEIEGDIEFLTFERLKGEINALFFDYIRYKEVQKMVKLLTQ
jgi:glycosyltransferase involved in cell wall biosynthesis